MANQSRRFIRPTPPQPPDPRMEAIKEKAASQKRQSDIQLLETQIKAATQASAIADKQQDRASREKIEEMKIQLELLKIEEEKIIHAREAQNEAQQQALQMRMDAVGKAHELTLGAAQKHQEMQQNMPKQLDLAHSQRSSSTSFGA